MPIGFEWLIWFVLVIASLIGLEIYSIFSHRLTLTGTIWRLSMAYPVFPGVICFVGGVVCGHLFWGNGFCVK